MQMLKRIAVLGALIAACCLMAAADEPGRHPYYLHALTDLRDARAHLDRLTPSDRLNDQEEHVIAEIDAAIREIKHAAIDDGKDIGDHMPVDAHLKRTDRYHKAMELLDKAHHDIKQEEDNPESRGLQHRALDHVHEAHETLERIIHNAE